MDNEEFVKRAEPFFKNSSVYGKYDIGKVAKLIKNRIEILSDIPEKVAFLTEFNDFDNALYENNKQKSSVEVAKTLLPTIIETLNGIDNFTNDVIFATLSEKANELGVKSKTLFYVMRIALTGLEVTPGGATEIADILGKEECVKRLTLSLNKI
jgi:glutamyl-tRNA synthetase